MGDSLFSYLVETCYNRQPKLRRWLSRLLYGSQNQMASLFGGEFILNPVRESGYLRASKLVQNSSLLRDEIGPLLELASLLRTGDTFVDAGANIGLFCCTLARLNVLHPNMLRFCAFEPHPDTLTRLRINASTLGIEIFPFALSNSNHQLEFADGAVSHVFGVRGHENFYVEQDTTTLVDARRLDEIIQDGPVVMKIDVEGHELEVLQGATGLLERGQIKAIFIDMCEQAQAVEDLLNHHGFVFFDGRSLTRTTEFPRVLLAVHASHLSGQQVH